MAVKGMDGVIAFQIVKPARNEGFLSVAGSAELDAIEGSPGIACPIIALLCAVGRVLIVANSFLSDSTDREGIAKTAGIYEINTTLGMDEYNTNMERQQGFKSFLRSRICHLASTSPGRPRQSTSLIRGKPMQRVIA